MKKKTIGRLAAASLAAMTVASTLGMTVSADVKIGDTIKDTATSDERILASGTVYVVNYDDVTTTTGTAKAAKIIFSIEEEADAFIRKQPLKSSFVYKDKDGNVVEHDNITDDMKKTIALTNFEATKTTQNLTSVVPIGKKFYIVRGTNGNYITTDEPGAGSSAETLWSSANGKDFTGGSGTTTTPGGTTVTPGTTPYTYISNAIHYAGSYVYYSVATRAYYPNYYSFYYDVYNRYGSTYLASSQYTTYSPSTMWYTPGVRNWFDPTTGRYSTTANANHIEIYNSTTSYDSNNYNQSDWDTYDVYLVNGRYYPTLSSAQSAAGNNYYTITKVRDLNAPQTNYFSHTTGQYYSTYQAALTASGNVSSNVYTFSYYTGVTDPYYNYGYGTSSYDPYYYYWLAKQQNGGTSGSTSSDTSSVAIGKRKGWTAVAAYAKSLKNGSSTSVAMNDETTVPSSVLSAIKGKDVTLKFVLDNGATVAINGTSVESARSIDIGVEYNSGSVPSKLVTKAKKVNDAVTSAKISIDEGSFGAEADVTVKFNKKRAGCTAKLYRYDESGNKLKMVSKAKVQSNGKVTFSEVDKGGDFVIVLS